MILVRWFLWSINQLYAGIQNPVLKNIVVIIVKSVRLW